MKDIFMDDKYYYKIRTVHSELYYFAKEVKEVKGGLSSLVRDEKKRAAILKLLGEMQASIKSVQDRTSPEFIPEFPLDKDEY